MDDRVDWRKRAMRGGGGGGGGEEERSTEVDLVVVFDSGDGDYVDDAVVTMIVDPIVLAGSTSND